MGFLMGLPIFAEIEPYFAEVIAFYPLIPSSFIP
jgi:hypothetical protein